MPASPRTASVSDTPKCAWLVGVLREPLLFASPAQGVGHSVRVDVSIGVLAAGSHQPAVMGIAVVGVVTDGVALAEGGDPSRGVGQERACFGSSRYKPRTRMSRGVRLGA